jgi:hypothetical protein
MDNGGEEQSQIRVWCDGWYEFLAFLLFLNLNFIF